MGTGMSLRFSHGDGFGQTKPDGFRPRCHLEHHSIEKHDDNGMLGEIGEKARTTTEEFLKMAKEKTDDVAEGTKETVQETKEVVLGESGDDKDKFKHRVEQGRYDQK
ncbi:unnamed protein product [Triticum turgidum subsp. durum]|uniref:Uncharacterized protein n=1 Tax=Triticum turgidum subsp. durum TaxID=4567 RepID=A0A9R0Z4I7_TRITD|nr:unnamed protein product [Triticum turgidum subsp. durum]